LRGQAYLQLGDGASAATHFKEILNHRGQAVTSPLVPLAQLGLARAAALQKDVPMARAAYETFLSLWSGADADARPYVQAKEEYAKLR
jgi:outer membrane protein assembly factor BamD (BamD/ComL family)